MTNEFNIPTTAKIMLYGVPGVGKTTLALSAENPLVMDFDDGVKRVFEEHFDPDQVVQIRSWADVESLIGKDASQYSPAIPADERVRDCNTVIVDTAGKMMDAIIYSICGNSNPKIQDYNTINNKFKTFNQRLSNLGKNIIYVAHADLRKENEKITFIPQLRERNFAEIQTELDFLGFVENMIIEGRNTRVIHFNPTERNIGKNCCFLPSPMIVPDVVSVVDGELVGTKENNFLQTHVIDVYKNEQQKKQQRILKYSAVIKALEEEVAGITNAEMANDFWTKINSDDFEHVGSSKMRATKMLGKKAKELRLVSDKKLKKFTDPVSNEQETA